MIFGGRLCPATSNRTYCGFGIAHLDSYKFCLEVCQKTPFIGMCTRCSNSHKWMFKLGFPSKHVIILVVTGIHEGGATHRSRQRCWPFRSSCGCWWLVWPLDYSSRFRCSMPCTGQVEFMSGYLGRYEGWGMFWPSLWRSFFFSNFLLKK